MRDIESRADYYNMMPETIGWCQEIAENAMLWELDKKNGKYFKIVGKDKVVICCEWEFNPIIYREDAMDSLLNCSDRNNYYMNIYKQKYGHEDDFLWTVTLGDYNYETDERVECSGGGSSLELAICEVLSEVYEKWKDAH